MVSGLCCQKTMKILGNFIYILRYWPKYSMLTIVVQDNGYAGLQELHSPKLLFSSLCCFLFRFSFPPLPADSSFSVKRLLLQTSIFLSFSVSVCVFSSSGCSRIIRNCLTQFAKTTILRCKLACFGDDASAKNGLMNIHSSENSV